MSLHNVTAPDFVCVRVSLCHPLSLPPGGPGLHDPCEKEPTNTLANMTDQQAEAITYSAQVQTQKILQLKDSVVIT